MKAKGVLANWNLTELKVEDIEKATEDYIARYTEAYDKIGKIKPEDVTLENTIKVYT
jgi:hypothetical protein